MKQTFITLLIVIGLALIVAGVSAWAFPGWLDDTPGGPLALLGAALVAVAALGGKLKDWREFLFPSKTKTTPGDTAPPETRRSQKMNASPGGKQNMRGQGGIQEQEMDDSPGGEQRME